MNPGALSVDGDSLEHAHTHFTEAMKEILVRFASEALSFSAFQDEVTRFVYSADATTAAEWETAVERVRRNQESLGDLPIKPAATGISVTVIQKTSPQVTPDDNLVRADLAKAA